MTSWLRPPDVSLHGTPVGSAGGISNQYAHMQGMSRGSQKPTMQSAFGNPFPVNHDTFSSNNVCMPQGGFALKRGFPSKDALGQVSPHHGNINIPHTNASLPGFNFRQEQVGSLETMQQKTTQLASSQGSIPLDPLEQKILYNMDDDSSFGRSMDMAMEESDYASALQSGSWSALMKTAVAEASSCDTVVQEEWSGLTFQSTELSTDNHPSKFMDEERQQPGWANSNIQNASTNSKPFLMLNDPSMSSSFSGFQQSGLQSFQNSPRSAGEWSSYTTQPKASNQSSHQIEPVAHLDNNTWVGQSNDHPESYMHGMALHNKVSQLCNEQDYNSKGLSGPQEGHAGYFNVIDNMSKNAVNLDQASLSDFHGNSKASEQVVQGSDLRSSSSTTFGQGIESNCQSVASHTREFNLNMQVLTSGLPSQLQAQHMSAPVSGESSQATLTDTSCRFSNLASSQDTSQQASTDPFGQPFPAFETASLSRPYVMSHMSPRSGMLARLQNTWKNLPASRLSSAAPSVDPSKNSMETTSLASQKGGTVSSDLDACYKSSQASESLGHSLEASQIFHQNYTEPHQIQAMKSSVETDPSKTAMRRYDAPNSITNVQQMSDLAGKQSIYEHNSSFRNQTHVGPDLSQLNSPPREELGGKALAIPVLQPSQGIGTFNPNDSQNQTKGMVYNHTDNSQVNLQMAPMWFKQNGTFRNGNMQPNPMSDVGLAKTAMEQFISRSIAPSVTGSLVASENLSSLHVLPSDLVDRIRPSIRAKKRKSIGSERISWHKEVTQSIQRPQDISTAEQYWACATNRLTEKIEDDFEWIGEDQPMHRRSKRRLVLTTQLIQQLLGPAPTSLLLGDACSGYDSATYFIARFALGDACSLACGSKKYLHAAQGNNDTVSKKLKACESDEHFTKVVEDFTDRAKKLENNFLRLERSSILDIRVDCQDLERCSVINRFAKFHMRAQTGTSSSGTVMSPPKSSPQKWVIALPMPRNLPEDAQCFSL